MEWRQALPLSDHAASHPRLLLVASGADFRPTRIPRRNTIITAGCCPGPALTPYHILTHHPITDTTIPETTRPTIQPAISTAADPRFLTGVVREPPPRQVRP